jgi:superfamily I DNA/RNA helicase
LISTEKPFDEIKIDHRREFQEATRLQHYEDADECFAEQARRRTFSRPMPPAKSISTIHKAKGLEFSDVIVMPCDRAHFSNTVQSRCLLYVAISRATTSLTFVISGNAPSPLIQRY